MLLIACVSTRLYCNIRIYTNGLLYTLYSLYNYFFRVCPRFRAVHVPCAASPWRCTQPFIQRLLKRAAVKRTFSGSVDQWHGTSMAMKKWLKNLKDIMISPFLSSSSRDLTHPMTDLVPVGTPCPQCDTPTDWVPPWYGRNNFRRKTLSSNRSNHTKVNSNAEKQHSRANFKSKQMLKIARHNQTKTHIFFSSGIHSNDLPGNVCCSVSGQANVVRPGHHVDAMSFRTVPTGGGSPTRARQAVSTLRLHTHQDFPSERHLR